MDVHELRQAFTASEALPNRLRALHIASVEGAKRGELPISLDDEPSAIVSVIPLTLFQDAHDLDVTPETALAPFKPSGIIEPIEMVEGVLLHTIPSDSRQVRSYAITYREGRTDAAWTLGRVVRELGSKELSLVWPGHFENGLRDCTLSSTARLATFGIEGPWAVYATLMGIREHRLVLADRTFSEPAWRDEVTLPAIRVETMSESAILPLFKSFWLAFGMRRPADISRQGPSSSRD